jgi:hypothetical protein
MLDVQLAQAGARQCVSRGKRQRMQVALLRLGCAVEVRECECAEREAGGESARRFQGKA